MKLEIKHPLDKIVLFLSFSFLWMNNSGGQPVYTVPWAIKQPRFVFPIYFEEASGMKDTIYFCYDSLAHLSNHEFADSIFGQHPVRVDTNSFYAWIQSDNICQSAPLQCDSQYKVSVSPLGGGPNSGFPNSWKLVGFRNGNLPLKISWDVTSLYSDSLPFVKNPGTPVAQGMFSPQSTSPFLRISENGNWLSLNLGFEILITDTSVLSFSFKDSCTVYSINSGGPFEVEVFTFFLNFVPWNGISTVTQEKTLTDRCDVYPNPIKRNIYFSPTPFKNLGKIEIFNITGSKLYSEEFYYDHQIHAIELDPTHGIYFFKFTCDEYVYKKTLMHISN